jgi:hypothetical protein
MLDVHEIDPRDKSIDQTAGGRDVEQAAKLRFRSIGK